VIVNSNPSEIVALPVTIPPAPPPPPVFPPPPPPDPTIKYSTLGGIPDDVPDPSVIPEVMLIPGVSVNILIMALA
jgi:hypothetical protein